MFEVFKRIENFEIAFLSQSKGRLSEHHYFPISEKEIQEKISKTGSTEQDDKPEDEEQDEVKKDIESLVRPIPRNFERALIDVWEKYNTFILEPRREDEVIGKIGRVYFPRVCGGL